MSPFFKRSAKPAIDVLAWAEYILEISTLSAEEYIMPTAKLFMTGGSQAVRLPAAFRFEGSEVDIRRDPVTQEVILSKPRRSWDEYFDWVRTLDSPRRFPGNA